VQTLRKGVDILVATPGRLLDLEQQGEVFLNDVEFMVLDEADRMLDMGFIREIRKILALMPENRQNLLFSATFSKEIKELAGQFMYKPVSVEATPENTTVELINQRVIEVDKRNKRKLAIHLINEQNWEQALIFTRTKHGANRLAQQLARKKITAAAIHGDKTQGARTQALKGFKEGKVRILVATDIAARGLDIPLLPYVLNLDLPNEPEAYVHRIGRTGRAGAGGEAISFCSEDELEYLHDIEKLTGQKLDRSEVEGFEVGTAPPLSEDELQQIKKNQQFVKKQQNRNKGKSKTGGSTDAPKAKSSAGGGSKKRRPSRKRGNNGGGGRKKSGGQP
jgi:ATP-dependent RNA helicase RhlE